MINKTKIKYLVDIGLFVSFIGVFVSGIFKFYPLRNYFVKVFEIIPSELMRTIHDWSGIIMGILVLIHVALNWEFISMETKNIFSKGGKVGK
jgi:cytochrome b subunit of formate dehydrogenase